MKTKITLYSIVIISLMSAARSYGQQTDSIQRRSVTYLSQYLETDTVTAGKVFAIQEGYKKAARQAIANGSLSDRQRRAVIDSLIGDKDRRLQQLLQFHQCELLIPTTERRRNWKPDTTAHTTN